MGAWPEFETVERDGKLIVGRSPRVRRGNSVGLGAALVFAVPFLLYMIWIGGGAPPWIVGLLALLSIGAGLWSFYRALTGDFDLDERRDIVFDRERDQVSKKGVLVCATRDIIRIDLVNPPMSYNASTEQYAAAPAELSLVILVPDAPSRKIPLLKGQASDLYVPASRIETFLGNPSLPKALGRT